MWFIACRFNYISRPCTSALIGTADAQTPHANNPVPSTLPRHFSLDTFWGLLFLLSYCTLSCLANCLFILEVLLLSNYDNFSSCILSCLTRCRLAWLTTIPAQLHPLIPLSVSTHLVLLFLITITLYSINYICWVFFSYFSDVRSIITHMDDIFNLRMCLDNSFLLDTIPSSPKILISASMPSVEAVSSSFIINIRVKTFLITSSKTILTSIKLRTAIFTCNFFYNWNVLIRNLYIIEFNINY